MKFVIQRVERASVSVGSEVVGKINKGYLVLVGVSNEDKKEIADKMIRKMIKWKFRLRCNFTFHNNRGIKRDNNEPGMTFTEIFEKYQKYGIEFVEVNGLGGQGNVVYQGEPVKTFIDMSEDGGVFSYQSIDGGEMVICTVYDDKGNLNGIKIISVSDQCFERINNNLELVADILSVICYTIR